MFIVDVFQAFSESFILNIWLFRNAYIEFSTAKDTCFSRCINTGNIHKSFCECINFIGFFFCVYMHTYIHACIYLGTYVCKWVYIHLYKDICICAVYLNMYLYISKDIRNTLDFSYLQKIMTLCQTKSSKHMYT